MGRARETQLFHKTEDREGARVKKSMRKGASVESALDQKRAVVSFEAV